MEDAVFTFALLDLTSLKKSAFIVGLYMHGPLTSALRF
jgi:hypothetical protein